MSVDTEAVAKYVRDLIEQGLSPVEAREHAQQHFGMSAATVSLIMQDDAILRWCAQQGLHQSAEPPPPEPLRCTCFVKTLQPQYHASDCPIRRGRA